MKSETRRVFMIALGALIVIGFFVLMVILVLYPIPDSNSDVLYLVIGALIASFSTVVNFYYGSSQGSHDKSDIMKMKERPDQGALPGVQQ